MFIVFRHLQPESIFKNSEFRFVLHKLPGTLKDVKKYLGEYPV